MAFDPFNDFETRGYLRNHAGAKDPGVVRRLEHNVFYRNASRALKTLQDAPVIDLERVQETHRILFQDVYPWAGDDRSTNAADLNITKGAISFQAAPYVPQGLSQALKSGNNINSFKNDPGKTIGELAYAHPFLDGNGRTITAVTSELARRAGFHIAWQETDMVPYLNALTKDLDEPNKGHLTAYLNPFIRESELGREQASLTLSTLPGLSAPNQNLERVQETQAILTIVAGSNGSGKSSLTSSGAFENTKIVDPDAIARAISPDNPEAAARRADKRALDQRKELLDKQQSFVVETTLSGNSTLSLMDEVAKLGFRVELKYIGLDNVDLAKSRVATRVASCGHNIPIDDIERRYSR